VGFLVWWSVWCAGRRLSGNGVKGKKTQGRKGFLFRSPRKMGQIFDQMLDRKANENNDAGRARGPRQNARHDACEKNLSSPDDRRNQVRREQVGAAGVSSFTHAS